MFINRESRHPCRKKRRTKCLILLSAHLALIISEFPTLWQEGRAGMSHRETNSTVVGGSHAEQSENLTPRHGQLRREYLGWFLADDQGVSLHILKEIDHAPRCGTAAGAALGLAWFTHASPTAFKGRRCDHTFSHWSPAGAQVAGTAG